MPRCGTRLSNSATKESWRPERLVTPFLRETRAISAAKLVVVDDWRAVHPRIGTETTCCAFVPRAWTAVKQDEGTSAGGEVPQEFVPCATFFVYLKAGMLEDSIALFGWDWNVCHVQ